MLKQIIKREAEQQERDKQIMLQKEHQLAEEAERLRLRNEQIIR